MIAGRDRSFQATCFSFARDHRNMPRLLQQRLVGFHRTFHVRPPGARRPLSFPWRSTAHVQLGSISVPNRATVIPTQMALFSAASGSFLACRFAPATLLWAVNESRQFWWAVCDTDCSCTTLLSYARSGQVRVLASTGPTRNAATPDVPVIAEYVTGYEVVSTQSLFAPVKTAKAGRNGLRSRGFFPRRAGRAAQVGNSPVERAHQVGRH